MCGTTSEASVSLATADFFTEWQGKARRLLADLQRKEISRVPAVTAPQFDGCAGAEAVCLSPADAEEVIRELCVFLGDAECRLAHVHVDLECLDDGAAESLFGTPGMLKESIHRIQVIEHTVGVVREQACDYWNLCVKFCNAECDDTTGKGEPLPPKAIEAFLDAAISCGEEIVELLEEFGARRGAAVARAQAAIEVSASQRRLTALWLLEDVMLPTVNVGFPCCTDICQCLADHPSEIPGALDFLARVLQDGASEAEESRNARKTLKGLTILNEMIYDEQVLEELSSCSRSGVVHSLCVLQQPRCHPFAGLRGDDGGKDEAVHVGTNAAMICDAAMQENICMLASEVSRRVTVAKEARERLVGPFSAFRCLRPLAFAGPLALIRARGGRLGVGTGAVAETVAVLASAWQRHPSVGSGSCRMLRWDGDGEGELRGRDGAEVLIVRLASARDSSAGRHWVALAAACLQDAVATYTTLVTTMAKIHEELECLEESVESQGIVPLMLAAADVQSRARDLHRFSVASRVDGAVATGAVDTSNDIRAAAHARANELATFLEEALAAGDELCWRLAGLTKARNAAVERAKSAIETAAARAIFKRGASSSCDPLAS